MQKKYIISIILILIWFLGFYMYFSYNSLEDTYQFHNKLKNITIFPLINNLLLVICTNIYHYSTFFLGAVFILTGIYVYIKKTESIIVSNFFRLMGVIGISITFSKPSSLNLFPAKEIEIFATGLAPYFLIVFFEYFPVSSKPTILQKFKNFVLAMGLAANLIYYASLFFPSIDNLFMNIIRMLLVINILITCFICLNLIIKQWKYNHLWIKNQLLILYSSLIISFSPILFFSIIPGGIFQLPSIPFSYSIISIIMLPIALGYLLTKQEVIDLNRSIRSNIDLILSISLTFLFTNIFFLLNTTITIHRLQLNFLLLISFLIFLFIYRLLKPLKLQNQQKKMRELQKEKTIIIQQLKGDKYLFSCATLITGLINKVIEVNDVCMIWKDNIPLILYRSGIFNEMKETDVFIQQLFTLNLENSDIKIIGNYHVLPIFIEGKNLGFIVIGQKKNLTRIDKEEMHYLEKIQSDASDIFFNAQSLLSLEQKLLLSQQETNTADYFNFILLKELEEEKKRLSIFMHDEVLQNLLFLLNKVNTLSKSKIDVSELEQSLIYNISEVREMCNELYPLIVEDLGLEMSLQAFKRKIHTTHNVRIISNYNLSFKIIPKSLAMNLFRIIKELIHNAIKHSSATNITLSIEEMNNFLTVKVEDDGLGFIIPDDSSLLKQNNMGLVTIKRKIHLLNGNFHIHSELNVGTFVMVEIPIERSGSIDH